MFYIISITVFTSVILILVAILLFIEANIVKKGDCYVSINNDEKRVSISSGNTLLSGLAANSIFLPSACGGSGSCAQCKCKVPEGGGDILPTELPHLTRVEKKDNVRLSCQLKVRNDMSIEIPAEIFSIKKYKATVVSNENISTFIKELVIKLDGDQELDFTAGAYIQIDIPEYELAFTEFDIAERFAAAWDKFDLRSLRASAEEPVFRAYSLANPPSEKNLLRFTVRIATPPPKSSDIPPGVGSSYVFSLESGDKITLSGPYGDFFVKDSDNEMCFVGGGAGMAPMRSHIFHQLNTVKTNRKITFWYGARSKQEMLYDTEFRNLDKKYKNFTYYVALSDPQPEDKWKGLTGFIHQRLYDNYLSKHQNPDEIEYYLCGPPMMLDAILEMLDSLGVEPEMILFDKF
ncbi:MAG: NADH:ubiquinone reductase (Na(+)-transporting) subunit F [Desulfobacterales bacterium]|nr:NADH:ubiquinone reductase (Na(+)-transporting) subunit F [Desulfobacterales bacterium]